jgi:hypothetical protein
MWSRDCKWPLRTKINFAWTFLTSVPNFIEIRQIFSQIKHSTNGRTDRRPPIHAVIYVIYGKSIKISLNSSRKKCRENVLCVPWTKCIKWPHNWEIVFVHSSVCPHLFPTRSRTNFDDNLLPGGLQQKLWDRFVCGSNKLNVTPNLHEAESKTFITFLKNWAQYKNSCIT